VGPSGVTEAVAARYREILPPSIEVTTDGPVLNMNMPGSWGSFFGNYLLHFRFLPAKYRLEQFIKITFGELPERVSRAGRFDPSLKTWPAIGTSCYTRVTRDEVRIWFGHSNNEDEAVLTVRPIPRSEIGI
jgi:hypothetical protein